MRSKKQIMEEAWNGEIGCPNNEAHISYALLEVLLDIRDEIKQKRRRK